jgi:hypothetical protein
VAVAVKVDGNNAELFVVAKQQLNGVVVDLYNTI